MDEFTGFLREVFVERLKNRFFGPYVISFLTWNWKWLLPLAFGGGDMVARVGAASSYRPKWFYSPWQWGTTLPWGFEAFCWSLVVLLVPAAMAAAYIYLAPKLNIAIDRIQEKDLTTREDATRKKQQKRELSDLDIKIETQTKRIELEELKLKEASIESYKERLSEIIGENVDEQLHSINNTLNTLKLELSDQRKLANSIDTRSVTMADLAEESARIKQKTLELLSGSLLKPDGTPKTGSLTEDAIDEMIAIIKDSTNKVTPDSLKPIYDNIRKRKSAPTSKSGQRTAQKLDELESFLNEQIVQLENSEHHVGPSATMMIAFPETPKRNADLRDLVNAIEEINSVDNVDDNDVTRLAIEFAELLTSDGSDSRNSVSNMRSTILKMLANANSDSDQSRDSYSDTLSKILRLVNAQLHTIEERSSLVE